MRSINEQCVRQLNGEVDESDIQHIMRYVSSDLDNEYQAIIKAEIEGFCERVFNSIREYGYNLNTTPIVFVGGGAVVIKNFGHYNQKNVSYILDVKANARGYGKYVGTITYYVVEVEAPEGYILDQTARKVVFEYKDGKTAVIEQVLEISNIPTEPKLPQTGDNTNPWVWIGLGVLSVICGLGVYSRKNKKKN